MQLFTKEKCNAFLIFRHVILPNLVPFMAILKLNFRFSSVQVSLPRKRVDTLSWSLF